MDARVVADRRGAQLSAFAAAHAELRRANASYRCVVDAWSTWRESAAALRRERSDLRRAARHHDARAFARRHLRRWRNWCRRTLSARMEAAREEAVRSARAAVEADALERAASLEAELAGLRAKLALEREERAELERNMRQAFMRSACALNMEAMSILRARGGGEGSQSVPVAQDQAGGGGVEDEENAS